MKILILLFGFSIAWIQNVYGNDTLTANIVIVREYHFRGGGIRHRIYSGDSLITILKNNSYYHYNCKPGDYIFSLGRSHQSKLNIKIQPGKTYYIHFYLALKKFSFGQQSSIPKIELVQSSIGQTFVERIQNSKHGNERSTELKNKI